MEKLKSLVDLSGYLLNQRDNFFIYATVYNKKIRRNGMVVEI